MIRFTRLMLLGLAVMLGTSAAQAVPLTNQCSTGDAINGIQITDVTGNLGGATDCFGTYDGNDPGPGGTLELGTKVYEFVSKFDMDAGTPEGDDIGLYSVGLGTSGFWGRDTEIGFEEFVIVLKAANSPGWAAWLFEGDDAYSTEGTWSVAWDRALSHLSFYAIIADDEVPVPEPGALILLALGLLGLSVSARRRK